jgi:predicted PurR-regulated permease PerM
VRSLEDNTLLLLVIAASLAFAWILWPFFGAVLWAAVLAIVFAPLRLRLLHLMPKRQNLAALATVLIVVALVILPLTLTAVSVVREATNFRHRMQAGTWNLGEFFQQFVAALPTWANDLLDRLGLRISARCKSDCRPLSSKAAHSLRQRPSISALSRSTSSSGTYSPLQGRASKATPHNSK